MFHSPRKSIKLIWYFFSIKIWFVTIRIRTLQNCTSLAPNEDPEPEDSTLTVNSPRRAHLFVCASSLLLISGFQGQQHWSGLDGLVLMAGWLPSWATMLFSYKNGQWYWIWLWLYTDLYSVLCTLKRSHCHHQLIVIATLILSQLLLSYSGTGLIFFL